MMKTETFIDIAPAKNKRVCSNCLSWFKWGTQTGTCDVTNENTNQIFSECYQYQTTDQTRFSVPSFPFHIYR